VGIFCWDECMKYYCIDNSYIRTIRSPRFDIGSKRVNSYIKNPRTVWVRGGVL